MTRVAAVDCGTNSLRLLVADVSGGHVSDVAREMEIVRLGEGVDRTGLLHPRALARTFAVLRRYAATIRELRAARVRMVATSATRDAANRDEFVTGCAAILGVAPDVLSGADEAATSFRGATAGLDRDRFPPPYLVVDVGGGSTELVLGTDAVEIARSVDLGCVRLTERCLRSDPPTAGEVAAAVDVVAAGLAPVPDVSAARTVVGLAGSVTTVAALALGLPAYDPAAIHLARVARSDVERVTGDLLSRTRHERLALPALHPGRADVIAGGALVVREVLRRWDLPDLVASERDILDGVALGLADTGRPSGAGTGRVH